MKNLLLAMIILAVFSGCKKDETTEMQTSQSTFTKLNGVYYYRLHQTSGSDEVNIEEMWDFDETNKAKFTTWDWSYVNGVWTNPAKERVDYDKEWKVVNGLFYEREWNNENANWTNHSFNYVESTKIGMNYDNKFFEKK